MKTTEKIVELAHDKELAQMAIDHIIKKNKCSSEELMQLAEAIPGAIRYAAHGLGIPQWQLRETVSEIPVDKFFDALFFGALAQGVIILNNARTL